MVVVVVVAVAVVVAVVVVSCSRKTRCRSCRRSGSRHRRGSMGWSSSRRRSSSGKGNRSCPLKVSIE